MKTSTTCIRGDSHARLLNIFGAKQNCTACDLSLALIELAASETLTSVWD